MITLAFSFSANFYSLARRRKAGRASAKANGPAQFFLHCKERRSEQVVGAVFVTNETTLFVKPYRADEKRRGAEIQPLESAFSRVLLNPLHQLEPDSASSRDRVNRHTPNVEGVAFWGDRHSSHHHGALQRYPDRTFIQAEANPPGGGDCGRKRFGRVERLELQERPVERRGDGWDVIRDRCSYLHNMNRDHSTAFFIWMNSHRGHREVVTPLWPLCALWLIVSIHLKTDIVSSFSTAFILSKASFLPRYS